jgi:hypothetical protein
MTKQGGNLRQGIFLQTENNGSDVLIEGIFWDHSGRFPKFS